MCWEDAAFVGGLWDNYALRCPCAFHTVLFLLIFLSCKTNAFHVPVCSRRSSVPDVLLPHQLLRMVEHGDGERMEIDSVSMTATKGSPMLPLKSLMVRRTLCSHWLIGFVPSCHPAVPCVGFPVHAGGRSESDPGISWTTSTPSPSQWR